MGFFDKALGVASLGTMGDDSTWNDITDTAGLTNHKNIDAANKANLAEAQKNRDFQQRNSDTAYQRAMADMKAAGINPMLVMSQGGASTPSGSQASVQAKTNAPLAQMALSAYTGIKQAQSSATSADAAALNATSSAGVNQAKIGQITAGTDQSIQQTNLLKEQQLTERFRRGEIDAKTKQLQKEVREEPNAPIYRALKRDTIDVAQKTGNLLDHGAQQIKRQFDDLQQIQNNATQFKNRQSKKDFLKNLKIEAMK